MEGIPGVLKLAARVVSTVQVDGRPARRTVLSRRFPTDPADLWDAITTVERIPRWFLPISGELRVGGRYQLEGNAGGVIEECEPPTRFRVTWEMGEGMSSWVTVTLPPEGGGTRLEVEHVGYVPEELWAQFGPSATGLGWDMALFGLGRHVETGAVNDPGETGETAAWMASPDGLVFLQESAAAWQAADVADGTPVDEAAAQARRTVAVYTGQA